MKDLYDIYEDGCTVATTPGNTTGMGNPMPPTDGEVGSEPICGKGKCKRKKKKVEESLLTKTKDKVKDFSLKGAIANWFAENQIVRTKEKTEEIAAIYETQIIDNGDGTFDIDTSYNRQPRWGLDLIMIPKDGIPDWVKIRNVRVDYSLFGITSQTGDLRNLDWNILNGKTVAADIDIKFWTDDSKVVLGPVRCRDIRLIGNTVERIDFDPKIVAKNVDIRNCDNLEVVSNIPKNAESVSLPRKLVDKFIKDKGLVPKGAVIYINGN